MPTNYKDELCPRCKRPCVRYGKRICSRCESRIRRGWAFTDLTLGSERPSPPSPTVDQPKEEDGLAEAIRQYFRRSPGKRGATPLSVVEIADKFDCSPKKVKSAIEILQGRGLLLNVVDGVVGMDNTMPETHDEERIDISKFKGKQIRIGLTADNHLGSKYYRADVLNALFDIWKKQGITEVYQCGNMIDGECRFNRHDLVVPSGIESQVDYFIKHWPQRDGITTRFVCGDDHEGWYTKCYGADVGKAIMHAARDAGRSDLEYLGYMEHDVTFHAAHGKCKMRVIHAGGGSAYAISYSVQKIVECVPLHSEILTKAGWRKYDEIQIGDSVLGYNPESEKCEWTDIRAINLYSNSLVNTYENDNFTVSCTEEHKWAMQYESRGGPNPNSVAPSQYSKKSIVLQSISDAKARSRIIQAAPAPDGSGFEAENHPAWMDREGSEGAVLMMTSAQRKSFIYGILLGEGTLTNSESVVFSQRPGRVHDAFVLACFLEGIACGSVTKNSKKVNGEDKVCCRTTMLRKAMRMVGSMYKTSSEFAPVWCPTTGLGTWVMRQGDTVTITGNSYQGGEKPNILLVGHFHKAEYSYPREVHVVQAGCTQDQTPFMRKKRLQAMVGGWTISFTIDANGIVHDFMPQFHAFYDRQFYETWGYRWE